MYLMAAHICGVVGYLMIALFQISRRLWQWNNFENRPVLFKHGVYSYSLLYWCIKVAVLSLAISWIFSLIFVRISYFWMTCILCHIYQLYRHTLESDHAKDSLQHNNPQLLLLAWNPTPTSSMPCKYKAMKLLLLRHISVNVGLKQCVMIAMDCYAHCTVSPWWLIAWSDSSLCVCNISMICFNLLLHLLTWISCMIWYDNAYWRVASLV